MKQLIFNLISVLQLVAWAATWAQEGSKKPGLICPSCTWCASWFIVAAEIKKSFRSGFPWLVTDSTGVPAQVLFSGMVSTEKCIAFPVTFLSGCNATKYHQDCINAKDNAGFKQYVLL